MSKRLPPGCGDNLSVPLLFNPYQQEFQKARRLRYCLACKQISSMDGTGRFICATCQTEHYNNITAPRVYDRLLVLSGRQGGKTLIGAHAAREEALVANSLGWVMGPTYKVLHDSTFPTLIKLIPPAWVKTWDTEHMELGLVNGAKIAFRSLEDPERARGPAPDWGWFDEAAQCPHRAYHVFTPALATKAGIVIATTTVYGFDWTYDEIEKRALIDHEPGYWACRYWTEHNPIYRADPILMRQIERERRTMPPELFAQEYRAERSNATGLIYGQVIEKQYLENVEAVRAFIPEWPRVNGDRKILIGLDSGADHPFGAVMMVVTEGGLVVVGEYLERMRAAVTHLEAIQQLFGTKSFPTITWAANKNEAQLRIEFALRGVGVVQADSKHKVGIQRVQTWLYSKKLFIAYSAPKTKAQMIAYRYAENYNPGDGQKKAEEAVFKINDELPDAIRYALMAWPSLPDTVESELTEAEAARWNALDERSRSDITRVREYAKGNDFRDLTPIDSNYPVGDFFNTYIE